MINKITEINMYIKFSKVLCIGLIAFGFHISSNASPDVPSKANPVITDLLIKAGKFLVENINKKEEFCRKGNIFKQEISVRSFDGRLCKIDFVGKLAEEICTGFEGYDQSKCHQNAIGPKEPPSKPEEKLKEEICNQNQDLESCKKTEETEESVGG